MFYINKQEWTHSRSLRLRLVVKIFLWVQFQDIAFRAVSAKLTNNHRMESSSRDRNKDHRDVGISDGAHVCHIPQHSGPPVYVSDSRARGGCTIPTLAGSVISPCLLLNYRSFRNFEPPRTGGYPSDSPLVAVSAMVSTPDTTLC